MRDPEEIMQLIEQNLYEFYFRAAVLAGLRHDRESHPAFIWNEPGKWPGFIIGGSEQADQNEFMNRIMSGLQDGSYPALWILREPAQAESFMDHCHQFGFRPVNRWTGMCLERDSLAENQEVVDAAARTLNRDEPMERWVELLNGELFRRNAIEQEVIGRMQADESFQFYALESDGRLVSTCLAFVDRKVAGLYFIATAAASRRKGFGRAVTHFAIMDCFRRGAERIVLHATGDGAPMYRKLGFREYGYFDIMWYCA